MYSGIHGRSAILLQVSCAMLLTPRCSLMILKYSVTSDITVPIHFPFMLMYWLQILQYTLKGERASRKSAETKHRRAQSATIRTSRYLDSILKVNQEIVAATSGMHEPRPSPALLSRPRAHRATWRGGEKNGHGPPSLRVGTTLGGVDVGAAVEEAVMVGRTGGDPVPTLTALYERIGFCAVQGEDGDDEGMRSLPTSPKRAVPGNTQREYGVQNQNNDEGMYRQRPGDRAGVDGFFPNDSPKELRSPTRWATGRKVDVGKSGPSDGRGGHGKGNGIKGYSFAHSPLTKVTSVAERSPEVLKRLEALASQLERERADVEQWYKEVVHRVGLAPASSQGLDVVFLRAQRNRSTRCLLVLNRKPAKQTPCCFVQGGDPQETSIRDSAHHCRVNVCSALGPTSMSLTSTRCPSRPSAFGIKRSAS